MKKEYARWGIYLKELEKYMNASCISMEETLALRNIYNFAKNNGFTDQKQDAAATKIIKKCKELGF